MSSNGPTPKPGILDIAPYEPGESKVPSGMRPIKLSSNESPLGPSSNAVAAFKACADTLERYPDGAATELRRAIAKTYGLSPDRIVCGLGSDELLRLIAQAYLGLGDEGIFTEHAFLMFPIVIRSAGATPVSASERVFTANVDEILKKVTQRTKVVFLANPNNPTGTYLPSREVRRLRDNLSSEIVLLLDGAYSEYVKKSDYDAGIELVSTSANTVMTRTFSKAYGLASLRLGWAYCPLEMADVLNRIRTPFNISGPAMAAGVAALQDTSHVDAAVVHNERWLPWLTDEITKLKLQVTPSVANFILIHFPPNNRKSGAVAADEFLKSRGIILRRLTRNGLPDALRMSVGTEADNRAVVAALSDFLA
jgi:histidinol-phosphate aminotransferase